MLDLVLLAVVAAQATPSGAGQVTAAISGAGGQISAITSPTEVAIGICVTYLGFDRFRYHGRVHTLIVSLAATLAAPESIIKSAPSSGFTRDERNFLAVLFYSSDSMRALIMPHKDEVLWQAR